MYAVYLAVGMYRGMSGFMPGMSPPDAAAAPEAPQSNRQKKAEKRGGQKVRYNWLRWFIRLFVCLFCYYCLLWRTKKMIPGRVYLPVCYDDERFRYCANGDGNDPVYFISIILFYCSCCGSTNRHVYSSIRPLKHASASRWWRPWTEDP